ncbi:MAG TPA: type II toxin-antitoxin system VapC family toxin [Anaerolineae bacterium]|nr:type II toxin-antitoxin system VapC family toxin [Anaerolineae bacterium]
MNVVDSSGWLEYFADAPNAEFFSAGIQNTEELIVPAISLFEVFKRVLQQRGEDQALQASAAMQQGRVVDLDATLALEAARLSATLKLPRADSIILATARAYRATLWTQDADFRDLADVQFVAVQSANP